MMKNATAKLGLAIFLALPAGLALAQDGDRPTVDRPGHREWTWDGGDTLAVGGSMIVKVRKDGPPRVVMTGPDEMVAHAYLRAGRLGLEDRDNWWRNWRDQGPIEVTITGASLNDVTVSGSSQVTLGTLQQPALDVRVSGSGSITANGRVEQLDARVSGSGNARLQGLNARRGRTSVSGSGHVDLAALDDADVDISGSGQVRISARPGRLSQSISGSGRLTAGGDSYTRRTRR
jgi:hypothetical protein